MTSRPQKLAGYPLPENEFEEETASYCVTIPAGEEYFQALYGQLTDLGHWWKWKRSRTRQNAATDTAMTWRILFSIEEDCGMSIDYDALKAAVQAAIYDSTNDIAKQIVSGRTTSIAVGDDGTVSDPSEGAPPADLPVDDPETLINEANSANAGGAIGIMNGMNSILKDLLAWFGSDATADTSLAVAQFYYKSKYKIADETEADAAVLGYYSLREISAPTLASWQGLEKTMYCKGATRQNILRWIIDNVVPTTVVPNYLVSIVNSLTDEQINDWYVFGLNTPSSVYLDYPCVPIPDETWTMNWNTIHVVNGIAKKNHRYLIKTEGILTDPDGDIQDTWYYIPIATGIPAYHPGHFDILGTGAIDPTANQVPYRADHKYEWTYDITADLSSPIGYYPQLNGGMAGASTGTLTISVHDLGEYAI